jgi:hypothetical protein
MTPAQVLKLVRDGTLPALGKGNLTRIPVDGVLKVLKPNGQDTRTTEANQ